LATTTTESARTAQEHIVEGIRQSQNAFVKAVEAWAETVSRAPQVPSLEDVPKPEEIVESTFDFAQQLLDAQREFARNVLRAASAATSQRETAEPQGE
jgi:hypothetical protein